MYSKDVYLQKKQNHECTECGQIDGRTLSGKILCEACATRKIATEKYRNNMRKRLHLCVSCGKQDESTLAGKCRCVQCMANNRMYFKRWHERKKAS